MAASIWGNASLHGPVEIKSVQCAGEGFAIHSDDIRVSVPHVIVGTPHATLDLPIGCDQADLTPDQARQLARCLWTRADQAAAATGWPTLWKRSAARLSFGTIPPMKSTTPNAGWSVETPHTPPTFVRF